MNPANVSHRAVMVKNLGKTYLKHVFPCTMLIIVGAIAPI